MNPTYNIDLNKKEDGSVSGYVYCLLPDKSFGTAVELSTEESQNLSEDGLKQAAFNKAQGDVNQWLNKSQTQLEGNFQP